MKLLPTVTISALLGCAALASVATGVTTVFSLGDNQAASIFARDSRRTPSLNRARLFVAGPVLAPNTVVVSEAQAL